MSSTGRRWRSVVALSGGVGGARILHGLAQVLPPEALTAIVNTGDDFEHWGLHIAPDLDTVMYTLSGLSDDERGWGVADEGFRALEMMRRYGGEGWFSLGDRDLATHLTRAAALRRGETLSGVTAQLFRALGVPVRVLPMSDGACRTIVETEDHGTLSFQEWFVRHRAPAVRSIRFEGDPPPTPDVLRALREAELIVIGPSNPYVSIDPILSRPQVREALSSKPVVALSPIVGGKAVKGPLADMIPRLAGREPSAAAVARHYGALLSGIMVETGDEAGIEGVRVATGQTIMKDRADRGRLAAELLRFAETIVA
jgi:LPPG:FO 2-phospho-L-lactate transferase